VVVGLGGQVIEGQADLYTRLWSRGEAGVEIPLDVLRNGRVQPITVRSIDRDTYYRVKRTY
jgi:S1-C subfamily serine protease